MLVSGLRLVAYSANPEGVATNPYEVNVVGTDQSPILIDFLNSKARCNPSPDVPDPKTTKKNSLLLCACFPSNSNARFSGQVSPYVCKETRQGHYALVVTTEARGKDDSGGGGEMVTHHRRRRMTNRWKVVVGSVIGAVLLGLLVVAMLVKGKKKAER
ncbi:hypothetical protein N665_0612s0024 [Sinapis alba]|nr:hypothetical protein N665_0612s0024 [Sinapis alba]